MSSCVVIQQQKNIFIAADKAISCSVNGHTKRLSNQAKKVFLKDNNIIFCSGNMFLADKCTSYIQDMKKVIVEDIRKYVMSNIPTDNMFEVFVAKYNNNKITTYQMSSYNKFKIIKRTMNEKETQIFSLGYNTETMLDSLEKNIKCTDVVSAIKQTFEDNICEQVGGGVDICYCLNGILSEKQIKIEDNIECFVENKSKKQCDLVIAETLMGRILLGEQLVITGEEGLFYVGDGTTSEQKKNDEFGIYIYDQGKVIDRIFLGVAKEGNTKRAMLRLKDRQGNQVVLSDEGIVQTHQFVCWDNISANYPMRIPYFCDEGVKENRKVMLSLVFEKYRAFEKGAASGGSVKSSKSGGGGTSASGGGGTSSSGGGGTSSSGGGGTSSSGGGGTSNAAGSTTVNTSSAWGGSINTTITSVAQEYSTFPEKRQTSIPNTSTFAGHYHYIDPDFFLHRHKIDLSLPSHSHSISVSVPSHSHTIPNHTHTMPNHSHTIPNHTHTIPNHTHTMPDHTHDFDFTHSHNLEYGIYEQNSKCSNVYVYVNNTKVNSSPINSNVSLNITKHIKIGQRNDIRIETETNGRVSCNLFTKSFVAF